MSNVIMPVGPPRLSGMWLKMRARVTAVGISPSRSTRSAVPVGKKGNTSVNDAMNILGRE